MFFFLSELRYISSEILVFLLSDRRELYVEKKFSVTCSSRVWHARLAFIVT